MSHYQMSFYRSLPVFLRRLVMSLTGDTKDTTHVVMHHEGHVLLLKSRSGAWVLPGGHLKRGEHARCALVREVLEETGVGLSSDHLEPELRHQDGAWTLYGDRLLDGWSGKDQHPVRTFFSIQIENPQATIVKLSGEHADYRWFTAGDWPQDVAPLHLEALEHFISPTTSLRWTQ